MIHDDIIVYEPPSRVANLDLCDFEDSNDWDLHVVNYRYARLCSIIIKTLYSHASLEKSPSECMASIRHLSTLLDAWRQSIPASFRPNSEVNLTDSAGLHQISRIQSDLGLKLAEASFAIHRWSIMRVTRSEQTAAGHAASRDSCVAAAKAVLVLTQTLRHHDSALEWYVR
ncbi:MAG: hypothetical protein Q9198_002312 [Flavoplaca austrocitrina]